MTPSNPAITSAKVCIRCGQDCSARPRTKDPQGRYTCRDCFDSLPSLGPKPEAAQAIPVVLVAPDVPPPLAIDPEPAADPGLLDVLLSDALQQQTLPPAVAPCPGCGHPLRAAAAICTGCGFNRATGSAVQTRHVEELAAPPRPVGPKTERDRAREFEAREAQRLEHVEFAKPIIIFVAAVTGVCIFLWANQNQVGLTIPKYLAVYALSVVVSAAIYAAYCLAKIGFHASFPLSALRLAAIVAACDLVRVPMLLFGVVIGRGPELLGVVIPFGLCIGLLNYFLDLDILDAIFLGILMTAGLFAAGFVVTAGMGA